MKENTSIRDAKLREAALSSGLAEPDVVDMSAGAYRAIDLYGRVWILEDGRYVLEDDPSRKRKRRKKAEA